MVTTVLGGTWVIEQPGGSCLQFFPPFRDLIAKMMEKSNGDAAIPSVFLTYTDFNNGVYNRNYVLQTWIDFITSLPLWKPSFIISYLRLLGWPGTCTTMGAERQSPTMAIVIPMPLPDCTRGSWRVGRKGNKRKVMWQHAKFIATKMERPAGKGQRDCGKQRPSTAIHFLYKWPVLSVCR